MRLSDPRFLRISPFIALLLTFGFALGPALGDDGRAALLADPQFVEPAQVPRFIEPTPDELRASLKVIATRTYAYYGFNNPEVQLHLPLVDNSTLARVEMPEPRLVDTQGRDVAVQLEPGLHDPATQIAEIRFASSDGKSPATFARAIGHISVRYPLRVETRTIKAGAKEPSIRIDGPFVDAEDGSLPETAPFAELQPLRAYDAQGRQLKPELIGTTHMDGERVFRRLGFHGKVATVEADTVNRWVDVTIRYDLPIADPLPDPERGSATVDERARKPDPRSKIEIEIETPNRRSEQAQSLANALAALQGELPGAPAIVSLTGSPPTYVAIAVESQGRVEEWTWNAGGVSGPSPVVTDWLDCKTGMAPGALALETLPSLLDKAARHVGTGQRPLQITVGQSPCGTPFIYIPFDGGLNVQYDAAGQVVGGQ